MKPIEIVLATHGENIFWANGLQDIVVEYSTKEQGQTISNRHRPDGRTRFDLMDLNTGRMQDIQGFMSAFRRMTEVARNIRSELGDILNYQDFSENKKLDILSGHKVVKIQNETNLNEANHFLNHIINEYDNLAEYTAFLQGHPHDHCKSPEKHILLSLGKDFSCLPSATKQTLGQDGHDLLARQFAETITKRKTSKSEWSAGACFMASKKAIRKNPLSWYKMVLDEAIKFKDSKFALERIWAIIISPEEDWS